MRSVDLFTFWLVHQADRDDPVGDLSRDFINDCRPRFETIEHLRVHIRARACREARQALAEARREFRRISPGVAA